MLSAGAWKLSQQNLITFVLVDAGGNEVTSLGSGFTLQLSKAGGAFAGSAGTKAEIGLGGYSYLATSAEANTPGPVLIKVTGAGIISQWLEYCVETRAVLSVLHTYIVTDSVTLLPIDAVCVSYTTDSAGNNVIWSGFTDSLGVARDIFGNLPRLDPGTYFVIRQKASYVFPVDTEVVA